MGARKGISALHRDILNGDDETLDPVDFLPCKCTCVYFRRLSMLTMTNPTSRLTATGGSELLDIHAHMERKHRI